AKVKKFSGQTRGASSTRKRRLPVNQLAVFRTTTSDGLPQPGHASVALATPITAVDPIEDSQTQNLFGRVFPNNRTLRNAAVSKSMLSPRMLQQPRDSPHGTRLVRGPNRPYQGVTAPSSGRAQPLMGLQLASDGFTGPELQHVIKKQPIPWRKSAPKSNKRPILVRELALGCGLLPVSA
ncbi:hypothetical protein BDW02DRAFT_483929, partial [Decorospora gaudefroyi]